MALAVSGAPTDLPTLDDVQAHLSLTADQMTKHGDELQGILDAAIELAETTTGPLTERTVTQTVTTSNGSALLASVPNAVVSVVDEYGTSLTHRLDPGGVLWLGGYGTAVVTYTVGRTEVPAPVRMAVLEIVRDLWANTQRGGGGRAFGQDTPEPGMGGGRPAIPPHATAMLKPYGYAAQIA